MLWLKKYKNDEQVPDASAEARMRVGTEVGELAKGLFGKYADATVLKADETPDIPAMIERTKQLIAAGEESICEAAFSYGGLYCAVDVLHKEDEGYAIYEVKSTTTVKPYHIADVAYQKYVLEKCGINVVDAHVVVLNNKYVRHGELDIKRLFSIDGGEYLVPKIDAEYSVVESNLQKAEAMITSDVEPIAELGCKQCTGCAFWKYCSRDLPKPNVFDLYGCSKKRKYYEDGIVSFDDLLIKRGDELSDVQLRQIDYALHDRGTYIDKSAIAEFLDKLTYPLYFLDFETMQLSVPEYDGTHPFEQIPFQYSLHYVESDGGDVMHKEFLAEADADPRRALAERLCADIPENACTLAYNASTEKGIVGTLAKQFPDLSKRLLKIQSGIEDLLPIFKKGNYYKREIGGSFSIKSVLPAVFPDKDYHNLDGVQNGMDAMTVFPKLKTMSTEQAQKARAQLLEYCERDTEAMVLLWKELVKVSK
ncbi:MAG: DUF2779 domain-containing protein [Clostridiales bacterium]|nr:DUF2779 domain-containing protein [Clostridiales bacterium]